VRSHVFPSIDITEFPAEAPDLYGRAASDAFRTGSGDSASSAPAGLANRLLGAAVVLNLGAYVAGGTYEVVWSIFLQGRGAGIEFIGFTFALFGLPVLVLSPYAGRLVDRGRRYTFIVVGSLAMAIPTVLYPFVPDVLWVVPLLVLEASGFAFLNPALYSLVAAGSPAGRTSTAQGIFGAAGTLGTIGASIFAGYVAAVDIRLPFFTAAGAVVICLIGGLVAGGQVIRRQAAGAPSLDSVAVP